MIILISGVSHTGKTLMAQRLLEKYHVPYLSIDHLKMGLYRSNEDCGFTPMDDEVDIANKVWPVTREIVKTNIENKQSLIVEGCYILPEFIKEFESDYLRKIIPIFIVFSSSYIKDNFDKMIEHRSVVESRDYPEERPVSQFIYEHKRLKDMCVKNNIKYFEINNDYESEIQKVYDYIDKVVEVLG